MKLVIVLVIVLMLFTGFSVMDFHSSVQKNKISIGNFNVQSTNHICCYFPISIKNSPAGTGYYQQLFIFTNPILLNSLNANRSNFYIASSNNTLLYTWIEAYNTTSLTVWSKVPNGTTSVNFEVFPQFDNLLSATGYIGEAPNLSIVYGAYFNAKLVFPFASDFLNNSTVKAEFEGNQNAGSFYLNATNYANNGLFLSSSGDAFATKYYGGKNEINWYIGINAFPSGADAMTFGYANASTASVGSLHPAFEGLTGIFSIYPSLSALYTQSEPFFYTNNMIVSSPIIFNLLFVVVNTTMPTFTPSSTPIMFTYHIQIKFSFISLILFSYLTF